MNFSILKSMPIGTKRQWFQHKKSKVKSNSGSVLYLKMKKKAQNSSQFTNIYRSKIKNQMQ